MMPSLLIAATLIAPGAPVPKDTTPGPAGPAPRVLAVKANEFGAVTVYATIYVKRKVMTQQIVFENGKQVVKQLEQEITTATPLVKNLEDFGGKFATADGTPLSAEQAVRKVRDGATVLVTADGKPVDPAWLRAVSRDTVVMITDELAGAHLQFGHSSLPTTQAPRLVLLGADEKGNVRLPVNPNPMTANMGSNDFNGFQNVQIMRAQARMVAVNGNFVQMETSEATEPGKNKAAGADGKKALEDLRFEAYDLTGKQLPKAEAVKKLKAGGLVLFAGDARFPDPEYLKAFHEDLIVLVSPELVFGPGQENPYEAATKKAQAPAGNAAAAVPAAPAVPMLAPAAVPVQAMKIQIAPPAPPAVKPAAPAPPPAAPKDQPAEKATAKPAEKPVEKAKDQP